MNTFDIVSFKTFKEEYMGKLNKSLAINPGVCEIILGFSDITYASIIDLMTHKKTAPLALFFDGPQSMSQVSKRSNIIEKIFKFLDINNIGRIDAYEFLVPILIFVCSNQKRYLEGMYKSYGVEVKDCISKDEFYYLIDTIFRGFAKLLVKVDDDPFDYKPRRYRLDYNDINTTANAVFAEGNHLSKEQFTKSIAENAPELVEFLDYIQKTCNPSVKMSFKAEFNKMLEDHSKAAEF